MTAKRNLVRSFAHDKEMDGSDDLSSRKTLYLGVSPVRIFLDSALCIACLVAGWLRY